VFNIKDIFAHGKERKTFITAEIGINHEGNLDFAKKLIEKARECGADAVKFQIYKTEKFYNPELSPEAYALFKSFELSYDSFYKLSEFARSLDIIFYGTPLDPDSLQFLLSINSSIIKIASSDITNEPFLYQVSQEAIKKGFLTIISTGFVDIPGIKRAVSFFKKSPLAILYCVSQYPAKEEFIDLNFIKVLIKKFHLPAGFSDHTSDIYLSIGAIPCGASLIERHFTIDNAREFADHKISLSPDKFKEMVHAIRILEKSLGEGKKLITEYEREITPLSMRSMYASRLIQKNEVIKRDDILLLRPGSGISLSCYKKLLNTRVKSQIEKYEKI